jgi:hypothetical protein
MTEFNGATSGVIDINHPEPITTMQRMLKFVSIGFDHVIPLGWDHILFIIGTSIANPNVKVCASVKVLTNNNSRRHINEDNAMPIINRI